MSLDQVLGAAASGDFAHYRPRYIVDAVNALVPRGKDSALQAIEAYHLSRSPDPQDGLFLVLRVLFVVPPQPGYHPVPRLGGSSPPPPRDLKSLPHFPLIVIDDVPLMMVSGYSLGGVSEPLAAHLAYFRENGVIRQKALAPSSSESMIIEKYYANYQRAYGTPPSPHEVEFITGQLR